MDSSIPSKPILDDMANVLSKVSANIAKAKKDKDQKFVKYWSDVYRCLVHSCRDIGYCNYDYINGRYDENIKNQP